jgi:signal transduction histidine kinase
VGLGTIAIITAQDVRVTWAEAANLAFFSGLAWLIALVLSSRARRVTAAEDRAERLQREREDSTRVAVAEERARIARELHDVVAHSVSVMTVQAGAARLLLSTDPRRASEPLLAVEETGRQALAEMRRLLGILRQDGAGPVLEPQPGLADLPALAATVREAGLPVTLTVAGDARPLPAGVELAAYRITQEALTNTLKHAGSARADVTVRYEQDAVVLEICDDGRATGGAGPGHGIVGMKERAALYGGSAQAGPAPGGGYSVRARLPVDPRVAQR